MEFEEKQECDVGMDTIRKHRRIRVPQELRPSSIVLIIPNFNIKECWLQSMIPIETYNNPNHALFANRHVFVRVCNKDGNWQDLKEGHSVLFVNCLNKTVKQNTIQFLEKYIPLIFGTTAEYSVKTTDCMSCFSFVYFVFFLSNNK